MVVLCRFSPQWIQNINTVCIVLGGPVLASLITRMRAHGCASTSEAFATSLRLMALAFLILPVGHKLAGVDGKSAFRLALPSYVLEHW